MTIRGIFTWFMGGNVTSDRARFITARCWDDRTIFQIPAWPYRRGGYMRVIGL